MRRSRLVPIALAVALLALVGGGVALLSAPDDADEATAEEAARARREGRRGAGEERDPIAAAEARAEAAAKREAALLAGVLAGSVTDAGRPVAGAEVLALREAVVLARTTSSPDGSFLLEGVAPGATTVVAREGRRSSAPLGPLPLLARERLEGLELSLLPGASLSGACIDARDRTPLAQVAIEVAGVVALTDAEGAFALLDLPPGRVQLVASREGFARRTVEVELVAGQPRTLVLVLEGAARVRGTVVDAAEAPIAGATVVARAYGRGAQGGSATRSDATGAFSLDVSPGVQRIEATGPAGGLAQEEVEVVAGQTLEAVVLQLAPAASIAGRVKGPGGGVPAQLQVLGSSGELYGTGQSLEDGSFELGGLPAAPARVVAHAEAGRAVSPTLRLIPGEVTHVELVLASEVVTGRVVEGRGTPVAGARVAAFAEGTGAAAAAETRAGADGRFRLAGLPRALLRVEATDGERRGEARGVSAGADVTVALGGGAAVGVVVVGRQPATDYTLSFSPLDPGAGGGRTEHVVSPDGSFRVPLPAGSWEIRAVAAGTTVGRANTSVPTSGDGRPVRIELSEGLELTGVVVDAESGEPISGARLALDWSSTNALAMASSFSPGDRARSGPDGRFRLSGLAPGRTALFVRATGYIPAGPIAAQPGGPELRVELTTGSHDFPAFGGIGVTLGRDGTRVVAAEVIEGGPGFEAGVRAGDEIVSVDGWRTEGQPIALVARRVRGPVGQPVVLQLRRIAGGGPVDFRAVVPRQEIKL